MGSRFSTVFLSSSSVPPTLLPSDSPPSCSARTGEFSSRFDVSAAERMSASPMLRTSVAFAANSGERGAAASSDVMNVSTFASSPGSAA